MRAKDVNFKDLYSISKVLIVLDCPSHQPRGLAASLAPKSANAAMSFETCSANVSAKKPLMLDVLVWNFQTTSLLKWLTSGS